MKEDAFKNALERYRRELTEYMNKSLEFSEMDIAAIQLSDEYMIKMVLEEAAERLRIQNEKQRSGWKRENDGTQDYTRKKNKDLSR